MKLPIIIVLISTIQFTNCRYTTNSKRSVYETISNKISETANYAVKQARNIKDFTVGTATKTINSVKSFVSQTTGRVYNLVDDGTKTVKNKFKDYINEAKKTATSIYDQIAPNKTSYECSDTNTENYMTTSELIRYHGYRAETHTIMTEDGYLLTVHRIPFSGQNSNDADTKKTVLLHHGILGTSADWVIPGPNNSLAYLLSDAGYDVWLANVRGNTYSRGHVDKNIDSYAYWNFSFHEVAQYDVPAVINFIIEKKGRDVEINYVGFSMGTTVLFAMLSTRTEYNNVLRTGFALAPITYTKQIKSPFKLLSKFGNNIEYFMKLVGENEFLPRNYIIRYMSKHYCKVTDVEEALCEMSMFLLCGHDKEHFNRTLTPLILGHVPAGTSTKTLAHYAQEINNKGKFQQFDYGTEDNMRQYGTKTPPEYPLYKVTLPITLFSAHGDWLSSVRDAVDLYKQLSNPVDHYIVPSSQFNHIDFLFARDTRSLVYDKLLQLLEQSYQNDHHTIKNI